MGIVSKSDWPELYEHKMEMARKRKDRYNFSAEILNSLILQSQDRQDQVRKRLN